MKLISAIKQSMAKKRLHCRIGIHQFNYYPAGRKWSPSIRICACCAKTQVWNKTMYSIGIIIWEDV